MQALSPENVYKMYKSYNLTTEKASCFYENHVIIEYKVLQRLVSTLMTKYMHI